MISKILNINTIINTFAVAALAIFILWNIKICNSLTKTWDLYHGDGYSQIQIYDAGFNFSNYGFLKTYFLPIHGKMLSEKEITIDKCYFHYPAGSEIVSGILYKIGIKKICLQRILLILLLGFPTLFILLKIGRNLSCSIGTENNLSLLLPTIILASPWFIYFSGNLHHIYWTFFTILAIFALLEERYKLFYIAGFFSGFFTLETIPMIGVMSFLFAAYKIYTKTWRWKQGVNLVWKTFVFLTLPLLIHLIQNIWALHSVKLALIDVKDAFHYRTNGSSDLNYSAYSLPKHFLKGIYGLLWFNGVAVLILSLVGLIKYSGEEKYWGVIILLFGFSWHLLFKQHAMIHSFTFRHIGLGIFFCAFFGLIYLFESKNKYLNYLGIILLTLSIVRLPLGTAEISENKYLLKQLERVIKNYGSKELSDILYVTKNSLSNNLEKEIIVNELAVRNSILPGLNSYKIKTDSTDYELVRITYPPAINGTSVQDIYKNSKNGDISHIYVEKGRYNIVPLNDVNFNNEIVIKEKGKSWKYYFLLFYILLV